MGTHCDIYDDSRLDITTSSLSFRSDARSLEQEGAVRPSGPAVVSSSRVAAGASEILGLLMILGEGYRLLCIYRCQVVRLLFGS